jgi:hypothetical protein
MEDTVFYNVEADPTEIVVCIVTFIIIIKILILKVITLT